MSNIVNLKNWKINKSKKLGNPHNITKRPGVRSLKSNSIIFYINKKLGDY